MSEREVKKPYPVPTFEDYSVASVILDEQFQIEGGAWVAYNKRSLVDAKRSQATYDTFKALSSIARFIEPITGDDFKPEDPLYRATHSFRAGMWVGAKLMNELYDHRLSYLHVHNAIQNSLPHSDYEGEEQYEANRGVLEVMGNSGLELMGIDSRHKHDQWSEDIVTEQSLRRHFMLGAGAILGAAHSLYEASYPTLKENYTVAQLFKLGEIEEYLALGSDSSNN